MKSQRLIAVLCACVVVAIGGVFVWALVHVTHPTRVPTVPTRSLADIHADWVRGVRSALTSYDQTHDALKTRDALLALSVRTSDQHIHLDLVLALQELINGQKDGAQKWIDARQAFTNATTGE